MVCLTRSRVVLVVMCFMALIAEGMMITVLQCVELSVGGVNRLLPLKSWTCLLLGSMIFLRVSMLWVWVSYMSVTRDILDECSSCLSASWVQTLLSVVATVMMTPTLEPDGPVP